MMQYMFFKDTKAMYELDADKKYYSNLQDSIRGFKVSDVEKYSNAFITADTLDELNVAVNQYNHEQRYGAKVKDDFEAACPKCGYHYRFDYYDHNDGAYTPAIMEDFAETIKCVCGCKFKAEIKVIVTFDTKILEG